LALNRAIPSTFDHHLDKRDPKQNRLDSGNAITLRSIAMGALLCAAIALGAPYTTMLLKGTPMGLSSATPAAFFLIFVVMAIQILLLKLKRQWAFRRGELITMTAMAMVSAALPTRGVTGMILPMITGTTYYATPENKWSSQIHPHQANWFLVDDPQAVKGFYEGGVTTIPWDAWLGPLLGWALFYGAFYLTLTSIMVILRRQWVENERLSFPMAQVPLAIFAESEKPGGIPPFCKNRTMWLGFAIPFFLSSLGALHHYFPQIPNPQFHTYLELLPGTSIRLGINFVMIGFAYFINSSIAFSLWFFYLISVFQKHFLGIMGYSTTSAELGPWSEPILGNQMMGALIVLVCSGLWFGRAHLRQVWQSTLGRISGTDDAEIMSYRSAVLGTCVGSIGMGLWLWQTGIPGWVAPLVVVSALIILVGLTRVVAEAGLPTISPAIVPAGFIVSSIGVPALGPTGMIATAYTLVWVGELLVFFMAPLANSLRLCSETIHTRRLCTGIGIAIALTLVLSTWYTLDLAYHHGGVNLSGQFFISFPTYPAQFALERLTHPTGPSFTGWLWTLFGAGVMTLLLIARHRLTGWPFHPLGFAVSGGWTMGIAWSSILVAWLIKILVLRYGGAGTYQRSRPFFMGLIMGQFVVAGLWLIIDAFTGTMGNIVPVLY